MFKPYKISILRLATGKANENVLGAWQKVANVRFFSFPLIHLVDPREVAVEPTWFRGAGPEVPHVHRGPIHRCNVEQLLQAVMGNDEGVHRILQDD